jgi:transposase InsO family protein
MTAGDLSITAMCRLAGVSRASFYRFLERGEISEQECRLREAVEQIALAWPTYGSRCITAELRRQGWKVNRKRVQRMMREGSLLCLRQPTCWLVTTDSKHSLTVFPNLIAGLDVTGINQLWVADITYIRLRQEFVFLAAILDAFSRRVIGWELQPSLDATLCLSALQKALRRRQVRPGLIHHSDRGVQYCSKEYVQTLARHQIRGSMARTGNPYDNALAERFWKTLKYEQVYRDEYRSLEQARSNIARFIDRIYNERRLHSALGYQPPAEFEATAGLGSIE